MKGKRATRKAIFGTVEGKKLVQYRGHAEGDREGGQWRPTVAGALLVAPPQEKEKEKRVTMGGCTLER